jgi:ketosteroid isomerase-like protein
MPRGNLEAVHRALDGFRRRDPDVLRRLVDPDEWEFRSVFLGAVEGRSYRGPESIERYLADLDEAFDDWHTEDERYFDVGGNKVVVVYRIVGKGKGSGVPIDQQVGIVFTLRDGILLLGEAYLDPQEALKAGLQHGFETFGRGDLGRAVDNLDPDVEWEHALGSGAPEEGVYRGREEVRQLLERLRESWEDIRVDARELDQADEGRYVVRAVLHARGRMSDLELASACEYVLEFKDSKLVRVRFALTGPAPRQALRAGVDEQQDEVA